MTAAVKLRRVVTGLDAEGRSCIVLDGPLAPLGSSAGLAWFAEALPVDNSGAGDCPHPEFSFDLIHQGGAVCMVHEFRKGEGEFWHATDTIDYVVMLSGEVVLELESGAATLRAGDFCIDRGVVHRWRNEREEPARAMIVMLPAHPVAQGETP